MFTKRLLGAALAVAAVLALGIAEADPLFTIITTPPPNPPSQLCCSAPEVTGDPSGTTYPWPGGPGPGAGVPSQNGGWPITGPGIGGPEPPFGLGTTGFDASYLQLNRSGPVTFQFMGGGTSDFINSFWLFYDPSGGNSPAWHQLFQDSHPPLHPNTNPCPVGPGATDPACDKISPSAAPPSTNPDDLVYNQYTIPLSAGLIPFAFDLGGSDSTPGGPFAGPINDPNTLWTNGIPLPGVPQYAGAMGNPSDDSTFPGYFLGIDPYIPWASGQFQTSGDAVYIGLSDRGNRVPNEHDYQDMVIRVIPEPGSLLLLGGGLIALAGLRRRKA